MMFVSSRVYKIILSFNFLILTSIIYIIHTTPKANGYELTIYYSFPYYLFIMLSLVYFFAYLIIFNIIKNKYNSNLYLILAFSAILFANVLLLSLSTLHGYLLYGRGGADVLTHIGHMKYIISTGHIFSENYYPIVHIIGVNIFYFSKLSLESTSTMISLIFAIFFPLNIYFLSSSMIDDKVKKTVIALFSTLLIFSMFHMTIHPSILSVISMPLLLGFYQYKTWKKQKYTEITILLLIFAFYITFMHPMTSLFTILILLIYSIATKVYYKNITYKTNVLNVIFIISVSFFSWYFSFNKINEYSSRVLFSLLSDSNNAIVEQYGNLYSTSNLSLYPLIKYFAWNYGHLSILFLISTCYICYTLYKLMRNDTLSLINLSYSSLQFLSFIISITLIIGYFIESEILRVTRLSTMFSVICCGLFFTKLISNNRKYIALLFMIIVTLSSFFVYNIYSSPMKSSPNIQLTNMECSGVEWIITYSTSFPIISNTNIYKYENYINGVGARNSKNYIHIKNNLPNNFGYGKYDSLSDAVMNELQIKESFYTIYGKPLEIDYQVLPLEVWDTAHKYNSTYVQSDTSVNVLYSNGEHENWLVIN